jgi:hypothetical protein
VEVTGPEVGGGLREMGRGQKAARG